MRLREKAAPNYLFEDELSNVDIDAQALIGLEEWKQTGKLILIPSESMAPRAVRQALGSVFTNVYAEGLPELRVSCKEIKEVQGALCQCVHQRRYGDRRYYQGCEYVNVVEGLAQRRAAQLFATPDVPADEIYANVQPLSGAAANNAVYEALVKPGDTVMGMELTHGGHLTHGSPYNRSGKYYNVVSYGVSEKTGRLDYDEIARMAAEVQPRMIVAGASAYPWDIDWRRLREIADSLPKRAYLMADISHPAGLVVAGLFPNPVGLADAVTFTTHKTMIGPRAAVILTTDRGIAERVNRAVFPGEQGGPHINAIAAMAVAFKIAESDEFRELQRKTVENAQRLGNALQSLGLRLAFGGTNTHLLLVDLNSIRTESGYPLKGDIAARILDHVGLVCNKNTIPGDASAGDSSAIRMGTTWVTQRGLGPEHMDELAGILHHVLTNIRTFHYLGPAADLPRGKADFEVLQEARERVERLEAETARPEVDYAVPPLDAGTLCRLPVDTLAIEEASSGDGHDNGHIEAGVQESVEAARGGVVLLDRSDVRLVEICGQRARAFLSQTVTSDVMALEPGQCQRAFLLDRNNDVMDDVLILCLPTDEIGRGRYLLVTNTVNTDRVKAWLEALSDGFTRFDVDDLVAKIDGPVVVSEDCIEGQCWAALTLRGPRSAEVLARVFPEVRDLKPFHLLGQRVECAKVIVARTGRDVYAYQVYVAGDRLTGMWRRLSEAGRDLGMVQAGADASQALRAQMGMPSYEGGARPSGISVPVESWLVALTKPYFIGQRVLLKEGLGQAKLASDKAEFHFEPPAGPPERTSLYEEHLKAAGKQAIINFAGWEMPVWYTSISEELKAVRERAALFDLAHMGVFEIVGPRATRFLDLVTTNYVPRLEVGEAQYSSVLDPDGNIMDDIFIYKRENERYMVVANAVNADKVEAWLRAVAGREVLIDREYPFKEADATAEIRNLKDRSAGADMRVNMALQGPKSLAILRRVLSERDAKCVAKLRKTEFVEGEVGGMPALISRTGYTGEETGFEIYAHPDHGPAIWNLLLEKGRDLGIDPAGLGARDAARTEAGFPLYGHELNGAHNTSPSGAGYGTFVKLHKPFFVGRKPYIEQEAARKQQVVRFRIEAKGARMPRPGDPVANARGVVIGAVTSCVLAGGALIGLAYVDRHYAVEGTKIAVFPLTGRPEAAAEKPKKELKPGDRVLLPEDGVVVSRFMSAKEKVQG